MLTFQIFTFRLHKAPFANLKINIIFFFHSVYYKNWFVNLHLEAGFNCCLIYVSKQNGNNFIIFHNMKTTVFTLACLYSSPGRNCWLFCAYFEEKNLWNTLFGVVKWYIILLLVAGHMIKLAKIFNKWTQVGEWWTR